jgi:hypothetical protein
MSKHFITGARAAYEMIVTRLRRRRPQVSCGPCFHVKFMTVSTPRSANANVAAKPPRRAFVSLDGSTDNRCRHAKRLRADHGPLRFKAGFRNSRPSRRRDRRQCRKSHRRHRCMDLCARHFFARSQLEGHRHRSRTMRASVRSPLRHSPSLILLDGSRLGVATHQSTAKSVRRSSFPIRNMSRSNWADSLDGWAK